MRAMVQTGFGGPEVVRLHHLPDPTPGPLDAVVEVRACALNSLDVIQRRGPAVLPRFGLPHIAGMDVTGDVAAIGAEVTSVAVGDRVVLDPTWGCGTCHHCRAGDDGYCPELRVIGGNTAGGLAERVAVPARLLHRLPDHVSYQEAAALPTAWSTAWHATYAVGRVKAGEHVVVQAAASSVSMAAIQLAKRVGAFVIAVAGTDEKLATAARLGADLLLRNDDQIATLVRRFTEGRGADLVLDHVGAATWATSLACLRVGGRLVTLGNTGGDQVAFSVAGLYHRALSVLGAGSYRGEDFTDMLAAYFGGGLRAIRAAECGLEDLTTAFALQEARETIGKIVVRP